MSNRESAGLTALGAVLSPLEGGGPKTDAVVERLCAAISLGLMTDGQQLPSETDLANQLGISTMTLREALAVLRQRGIVHTKRGRGGGSFIRGSAEVLESASLARLQQMSIQELRDLGDEHFAVTGAAAVFAARRGLRADIARLRSLADRLKDSSEPISARRADSRFHIEMAVCAQSTRLTRAEVALQAELSALLWLPRLKLDPEAEATAHRNLVDAIEREDDARARELAESQTESRIRRLVALRLELSDR
ncbi:MULTISPECIES: FadR/GntR family transcriptional regulator [Nocardia]|uniref:FadR/GntR family transcriptional regulator n=1 Tax=Nocardia TaxID=1817 RepID=UPI0019162A63|nr:MULTISPECIES: GntR family transcriptional regulator [Nocardia]UAK30814.1 GntR family transcriptional regulator [Nocardia asteroides]